MSLEIQNCSPLWNTIEKPTALKGCFPYVRNEKDHSLIKIGKMKWTPKTGQVS
jgi:hypothetical protein